MPDRKTAGNRGWVRRRCGRYGNSRFPADRYWAKRGERSNSRWPVQTSTSRTSLQTDAGCSRPVHHRHLPRSPGTKPQGVRFQDLERRRVLPARLHRWASYPPMGLLSVPGSGCRDYRTWVNLVVVVMSICRGRDIGPWVCIWKQGLHKTGRNHQIMVRPELYDHLLSDQYTRSSGMVWPFSRNHFAAPGCHGMKVFLDAFSGIVVRAALWIDIILSCWPMTALVAS